MGATVEQVEQLLSLLREVDLPTLLAFDRKLHLLLEQKAEKRLRTRHGTTIHKEFCQRYPHMPIDPDLLALVGCSPQILSKQTKPSSVKPSSRDCRIEDAH